MWCNVILCNVMWCNAMRCDVMYLRPPFVPLKCGGIQYIYICYIYMYTLHNTVSDMYNTIIHDIYICIQMVCDIHIYIVIQENKKRSSLLISRISLLYLSLGGVFIKKIEHDTNQYWLRKEKPKDSTNRWFGKDGDHQQTMGTYGNLWIQ